MRLLRSRSVIVSVLLVIVSSLTPVVVGAAGPMPQPARHASGSTQGGTPVPAPRGKAPGQPNGASSPMSQPTSHINTIVLGLTGPWDVGNRMDADSQLLGATPKIEEVYQDWAHQGFWTPNMDAIANRGATPVISWEPEDYTQEPNPQPNYNYASIISGTYDSYIHQFARDAKAWKKHVYLKFAAEMNIDVYPWGVGNTGSGNTSAQFVTMWRHVHDIFTAEGTANVIWVWCPNVIITPSAPFPDVYPGDNYVDWVGLDGYNWGTLRIGWQTFPEVFGDSYNALIALTSKPIIICEVASNESGGNKAQWITQSFLTDIPTKFPLIRAVIWFDEIQETDWRYNSSAASLAAFQQVAQSPLYQGSLP